MMQAGRFGARPDVDGAQGPGEDPLFSRPESPAPREPIFDSHEINEDRPIYPGGPLISEVESWKKQFVDEVTGEPQVFITDINGRLFIWRVINRFEYKAVMTQLAADPLQREEMLCEVAVLWPQPFTYQEMAKGKGGTPSALAEAIMQKSDFTKDAVTRQL